MTFTYPITSHTRADALTAVMRRRPPRLRLTQGVAAYARSLEQKADRASVLR